MVRFHPGPLQMRQGQRSEVRGQRSETRSPTPDLRPREAAWSARLPVTQEITGSNPVEVAFDRHGVVRKSRAPCIHGRRPSSNLGDCGFNSRPRHLNTCVGWASVSLTDCKSAASGCAGSTPARRTDNMARSSIGLGCQPLTLARRVRFPHGLLNGQVAQLEDARRSERRARKGLGVQISPWSLTHCRRGRCPTGSHKAGAPGSIPGPATMT